MARGVINYWPSIFLTVVLLIGIAACFKRLDNLVVDEVKALISVLFGFATTCLFLSYIWLIQRKPLSRTWPPNQAFPMGVDALSMHPRGRTDSMDSSYALDMPIRTISSCLHDKPPAYEDALANSRPINWEEKSSYCNCFQSQSVAAEQQHHTSIDIEHQSTGKQIICSQCARILPPAKQFRRMGQMTNQSADKTASEKPDNERKTSYTQLDVGQLMSLSSSPPRYADLLHQQRHSKAFL